MRLRYKVLITTLVFGIPTIPLGMLLWPVPHTGMVPNTEQMPFFIVLAIVEGIAFGLGVSLLLFGSAYIQRVSELYRKRFKAMYVSIIWLLVSWWPHDHFHSQVGSDMWRLIRIEYAFHVTLILAAVVLGYCFITLARDLQIGSST